MAKNFCATLRSFGFKKMSWDKCPQGFRESNYPCFSLKEKNIWVEVYLSDKPPYCFLQSTIAGYRGKFFYDADELRKHLTVKEKL